MKAFIIALALVFTYISVPAFAASTPNAVQKKGWSFDDVRLIPVQSGGRMKPVDSFSRETVLFLTGSRSYQGWDPVDLLFSWIAFPEAWESTRFIQVGRIDVRRQLGLDESRTRFAPLELFRNLALIQYAEKMQGGEQLASPVGATRKEPRDQELRQVLERISLFRDIVSGQVWSIVPQPAPTAWLSLAGQEKEGQAIRSRFAEVLKSYHAGDQARFEKEAAQARATIESQIPRWDSSLRNKLRAETTYNVVHPFRLSWILYLAAALTWVVILFRSKGKGKIIAHALTLGAFLIHVFGFVLRSFVAGRAPVTNMYESIVWVMFGVIVFAWFLYFFQRQPIIWIVANVLATLGLIAADAAPAMLDPGLHPLMPVLRSNYWLTVHVLTITLGYAALALTLGLANVSLFHYWRKGKGWQAKAQGMNQLTYRAMQIGVVLLAAGTILGGIWADYSWGRFWGWDPKETWALIALMCYLVIMHGRFTKWVGQFAFAVWSVICFLSVVMAWYGVNFILGAGLHSYGFSSGGLSTVSIFTALQLTYVIFVAINRSPSS